MQGSYLITASRSGNLRDENFTARAARHPRAAAQSTSTRGHRIPSPREGRDFHEHHCRN